MSRPASFANRWTEAEIETLRNAWSSGGINRCLKALPGRSRSSIFHKIYKLKLPARRPTWSPEEIEILSNQWGLMPIDDIAKTLGRTIKGICGVAYELSLPFGAPPGWEFVSQSCRRVGYAYGTYMRIIRWADVRRYRAYCRNTGRTPNRIVRPEEVDAAVSRWLATENLATAAARLGLTPLKLRRWMRWAGEDMFRTKDALRAELRAEREAFDRAIAWRASKESLVEAARRIGVNRKTLKAWLSDVGHAKSYVKQLFDKSLIDEMAAKRKANPVHVVLQERGKMAKSPSRARLRKKYGHLRGVDPRSKFATRRVA